MNLARRLLAGLCELFLNKCLIALVQSPGPCRAVRCFVHSRLQLVILIET